MALVAAVDVDELFRSHKLPKIVDILENTKQDVEAKKQELREKVGNHYREVLTSSDSIQGMFSCVSEIDESQVTMGQLREQLKTKLDGFQEKTRCAIGRQFTWVKKVKELVDLPTSVHHLLGKHKFIDAAAKIFRDGPTMVATLQAQMPEDLKSQFRWVDVLRDHSTKMDTLKYVLRASCVTAFDEPISMESAREAIAVGLALEDPRSEVDYVHTAFGKCHEAMKRSKSSSLPGSIICFESTVLAAQCFDAAECRACVDRVVALASGSHGAGSHLQPCIEPVSEGKGRRIKEWSERAHDEVASFISTWSERLWDSWPADLKHPDEVQEFCERTSEAVWDFRLKKGWSEEAWKKVTENKLPESLVILRRRAEARIIENIRSRMQECEQPLDVSVVEPHIESILKELESQKSQRQLFLEALFQAVTELITTAVSVESTYDVIVNPKRQALLYHGLYESICVGTLSQLLHGGFTETGGMLSSSPLALTVCEATKSMFSRWASTLHPFVRGQSMNLMDLAPQDYGPACGWGTVEAQARVLTVPSCTTSDVLEYVLQAAATLSQVGEVPLAVDAVKKFCAEQLQNIDEGLAPDHAGGMQTLFDAHFLFLILGPDYFAPTLERIERTVLRDPVDKLIYTDLIKRLAWEHLHQGCILMTPFLGTEGLPPMPGNEPIAVQHVHDPLRPAVSRFHLLPVYNR